MSHKGNCQSQFPVGRITGWGLIVFVGPLVILGFVWLLAHLP